MVIVGILLYQQIDISFCGMVDGIDAVLRGKAFKKGEIGSPPFQGGNHRFETGTGYFLLIYTSQYILVSYQ